MPDATPGDEAVRAPIVPSTPPGGPVTPPADQESADWPAQAADTIVNVVGQVRAQTVDRAELVARGVVFGLPILLLACVLGFLLVVALLRTLQILLSWDGGIDLSYEDAVWVSYVLVGALFLFAGQVAWRRANKARRTAE